MIGFVAAVAVASSQTFWFLHPTGDAVAMDGLCLVGPPAADGEYTVLRRLSRAPVAVAWAETSAWVLPASDAERPSLLAVRAEWDVGLDTWVTRPAEGFARLPPVPAEHAIGMLLGSRAGPTVVLKGGGGVYSLRGGRWHSRPSPPLESSETVLLAAASDEEVLLCVGDGGPSALLRSGDPDGGWTRTPLDPPDGEPTDLLYHNGTPVLGVQTSGGQRTLGYLQGGVFASWAEVPAAPPSAAVVATARGLALLDVSAQSVRLKPLDGLAETQWATLERASRIGARLWSIVVAVGIGVVVLLIIVMGRRVDAVPAGVRPAPLSRRTIALGLDLVPGMLTCVVAFGAGSMEVAAAIVTGPLPATIPMLLTLAAVTAVWGVCWELATGQTAGKMLLGLRVVTAGEGSLQWWQVLLRNLLKGIVILAPPLAVLVVLTPLSQSPGDIVARTLVVDKPPKPPQD